MVLIGESNPKGKPEDLNLNFLDTSSFPECDDLIPTSSTLLSPFIQEISEDRNLHFEC